MKLTIITFLTIPSFQGCSTVGGKVYLEMAISDSNSGLNKDSIKKLKSESSDVVAFSFISKSGHLIVFSPFMNCYVALEVINNSKEIIKVNWAESFLKDAKGEIHTLIPWEQVKNSGSVAPSTANPSMIPPGTLRSFLLLSLNLTSTRTSYASLYQGYSYVGTYSQGTYVSSPPPFECEFDDYAKRFHYESEKDWKARVEQIAYDMYQDKELMFSVVLEAPSAKETITVPFTLLKVNARTNSEISDRETEK